MKVGDIYIMWDENGWPAKITDIYTNKDKVIIVEYKYLVDGNVWSGLYSSDQFIFQQSCKFSQKLTDLKMIKDIIEWILAMFI